MKSDLIEANELRPSKAQNDMNHDPDEFNLFLPHPYKII
jgi:hypothetical protein